MKAGRLKSKIIVKAYDNTPNSDGSPNETYTEVFIVWGNVIFLRGKGYFENYQYLYDIQGRVFIRYRNDIELDYRINIDGTDYDIDSIRPVDNKKKELEIVFKTVE